MFSKYKNLISLCEEDERASKALDYLVSIDSSHRLIWFSFILYVFYFLFMMYMINVKGYFKGEEQLFRIILYVFTLIIIPGLYLDKHFNKVSADFKSELGYLNFFLYEERGVDSNLNICKDDDGREYICTNYDKVYVDTLRFEGIEECIEKGFIPIKRHYMIDDNMEIVVRYDYRGWGILSYIVSF